MKAAEAAHRQGRSRPLSGRGQILADHHPVSVGCCHDELPHAVRLVGRRLEDQRAAPEPLVVQADRIVHVQIAEAAVVARRSGRHRIRQWPIMTRTLPREASCQPEPAGHSSRKPSASRKYAALRFEARHGKNESEWQA